MAAENHYSQSSFLPIDKLGRDLDSRFYRYKDTPITEEIRYRRHELREKIGMTRIEKNKAHIDKKLNIFLETRICRLDIFHIFEEYDRVTGEIPVELDVKINEIKDLVKELFNGESDIFKKYELFHQFEDDHKKEWNIIDYRREK